MRVWYREDAVIRMVPYTAGRICEERLISEVASKTSADRPQRPADLRIDRLDTDIELAGDVFIRKVMFTAKPEDETALLR